MNTEFHEPVLLAETLSLLTGASSVLDCTFGGGGHTAALLQAGAHVTALDRDPGAVQRGLSLLANYAETGRLVIHQANFSIINEIVELDGKHFDGILMDLGVSSHQFDDEERGFTFREDAPLDMRMGSDAYATAAELLNEAGEKELEVIFTQYSEEPKARRLAAEITRRRAKTPFVTSNDLVNAVRAVLGARSGPSDFARIFQGIRIAVNDELTALTTALPLLREKLKPSGVIVVISYHSGEDRIVKNSFRDWTKGCICPPRQPICTCGITPMGRTITKKSVVAGTEELTRNPRSRSARLRAWQKKG